MKNWRSGNEIKKMYILNEHDLSRIGNCWMEGRLLINDIILCVDHTGDCFNNYVLIYPFMNGIKAILESKFGAYQLGTKLNWQPSETEYYKLLADEDIIINPDHFHPLYEELIRRKILLTKNQENI